MLTIWATEQNSQGDGVSRSRVTSGIVMTMLSSTLVFMLGMFGAIAVIVVVAVKRSKPRPPRVPPARA